MPVMDNGKLGSVMTSLLRTPNITSMLSTGTKKLSSFAMGSEADGIEDGLVLTLGLELGLKPSTALTVTTASSQKGSPRESHTT
mmetsp:Transcript_6023/g.13318  ORF Transcript_6023/g.13318 Transcript_6023/m.13318 type:complete len:84 (-) Transcript_6023:931-1182(-)